MRESVFMDASAWIALYDASDGNHTMEAYLKYALFAV
jgi:hypothetical protein